jgi:mersacidin/lichenicidin family type 2 lantibiotic
MELTTREMEQVAGAYTGWIACMIFPGGIPEQDARGHPLPFPRRISLTGKALSLLLRSRRIAQRYVCECAEHITERNIAMNPQDIIRAWKDRTFRKSLSRDEQQQLPAHPCGIMELTTREMEQVAGARTGWVACVTTIFPGGIPEK